MLSLLDKGVQTAKWHGKPLPETLQASVKEVLNGDFVLTFSYPITDSGLYQELKEDYLVRSPVPVLGHQLFRIKKVIEGDRQLEVTAYHISDDVMTRLIAPFRCDQVPCGTALSQLVMASHSPLGNFSLTSDLSSRHTYTSDKTQTLYSVLLDGKHSIVGTWEGELERDNLSLAIRANRGEDRGVILSTHFNLKSYERTKDSSTIITRIHATSTFKEEGQVSETTLSVMVDSPLISHYPFIHEVTYTNNNLKTREDLIDWASQKFRLEGIDKPRDAIRIEAFDLDGQTVHLGDRVRLKSRLHGIDMTKKAVAYDYDPLRQAYRSITFDDKASLSRTPSSGGLSTLAQSLVASDKRSEAVAVKRALDNANRAFDRAFEKRKEAIDEAIEQAQSRGEVYADKLRAELDANISTLGKRQEAYEAESNRTTRALLAKAGANTSLAREAQQQAEEAQTGVLDALRRADQAKRDAISEASRLTSLERSQTDGKIETAKSQAISEASRLVDVSKALLSGQLETVTSQLTQTRESIQLLASQAQVDSLTGRVTSAESSLRLQADHISQRVTRSDFDQAKSRLSSAESRITQLGHRITTEIGQVEGKFPKTFETGNLLLNSSLFKDMTHWVNNGLVQEEGFVSGTGAFGKTLYLYQDILPVIGADKPEQVYTLSADVRVEDLVYGRTNPFLNLYISGGRQNGQWFGATYQTRPDFLALNDQGWVRVHSHFSLPLMRSDMKRCDAYVYLRDFTGRISLRQLKLTRGNLKTDWSPSPQDAVAEVTSLKTQLHQTASGLEQVSTRLTETSQTVSRAESQIRQLVTEVSSRVSQTDFDRIKETLQNHSTTLSQTTNQLALKADKTVTDSLSQVTRQLRSDMTVAQGAITQKVSQTDFNTVTGRLSRAESSLQTLAGQLETKLSQTEVNRLVDAKGFVTTSSLTNTITQTAEGLRTAIRQVETKIPDQLGGVNLLRNSSLSQNHDGWVNRGGSFREGDNPSYVFDSANPQNVSLSQKVTALVGEDSDDQVYTYSFEVKVDSVIKGSLLVYFGGYADNTWQNGEYLTSRYFTALPRGVWQVFRGQCRLSGKKALRSVEFWLYGAQFQGQAAFRRVKLERGSLASDWSPALEDMPSKSQVHEVTDTVSSHTRTIGEHTNHISQVLQTANGLVSRVGSLETSRATSSALSAVESQVSQLAGAWSVRTLTSSGDILSQLNLTKDGAVKIDGKLIHITGQTVIDNGVIRNAKIASLDAGKLTTGLLSAARIGVESITADKLKVDQAFFNKLTASDAYLRTLFSKSAFISQVQAVTLSASQISGGILSATNGAMTLNLSQGHIKFFTNSPSISREVAGYPHQWVSFETGTSNGRPCGVTVIGSNRWKNWNSNDGGFVGIRAWNGDQDDQIDVVGDKVHLASAASTNSDGWDVVTLPNRLSIDAHRSVDRPSSQINIGDIRLFRTSSNYVSLKEVLHQFNHNFKHLVNITGRGDVILTWDTIK